MKSWTTVTHHFKKITGRAGSPPEGSTVSEWPFFVIVTLALTFIYAISVSQNPALQEPARLILYTLSMLVYLALFWLPLFITFNSRRVWVYLLVQTSLAFVLSIMAGNVALIFGVFAPLLGIAIGLIGDILPAALYVILLLALSALAVGLSAGWQALEVWPLLVIPMTIFIIIYVVLYGRQTEAREQAQELAAELEAANTELADYASQVEELTLATERQRMARELHDTLAQGVAGLILQLEAVNAHLDNGDADRAQTIVRQAMGRARNTLAEAREAIDDLRQTEERALDLDMAIREKANRFSAATAIPCHLELALLDAISPQTVEQVLRTVSEAFTNIARHAQATEVWVKLMPENDHFLVEIRDNGRGFDLSAPVPAGHYGLQGIRERARLAHGSVEIESAPSEGTAIRLQLPLHEWQGAPT